MDRDQQLEQALDRVSVLETAFEDACVAFGSAENEYRVQFAKAFLMAEGTEKARHNTAILAVERFLRERDRTEAVKEFTKEKLRDAQAAVSARQSLLSADVHTSRSFGG